MLNDVNLATVSHCATLPPVSPAWPDLASTPRTAWERRRPGAVRDRRRIRRRGCRGKLGACSAAEKLTGRMKHVSSYPGRWPVTAGDPRCTRGECRHCPRVCFVSERLCSFRFMPATCTSSHHCPPSGTAWRATRDYISSFTAMIHLARGPR